MFPGSSKDRISVRGIAMSVLLLAVAPASGCLILPEITPDYGIEDPGKLVAAVEPGKTTKRELLKRFRPPVAIAARDEITAVPVAYDHPALRPGNAYAIRSDTWFELFSADRELTDYHRVYYYATLSRSHVLMFFWIFNYRGSSTETDRLWFLVDERTGTVEDYAFKQHGEPVLFGRPRTAGPRGR